MSYFSMLKAGTLALGIVVLVVAALLIHGALKRRKNPLKKILGLNITAGTLGILGLVGIIATNTLTRIYKDSINNVMAKTVEVSADTNVDDWKALAYEIAEEGMVLMENKDNTLPLTEGTQVNLLGSSAYSPYYSGSGSGSVSASDAVNIVSSLTDAGIMVNPAISSLYGVETTAEEEEESSEDSGPEGVSFSIGEISEIPASSYTGDTSFESMAEYSDTAIVVIGRPGAEGADLPYDEENDYLVLLDNEKDLLEAARESFDTLIVVLNMANAMEMTFVEEYDVDAVIWAGVPGPYGFKALGEILTGAVNPSGSLPDTWVYDNDSIPANENFGEQTASNAEGRYYVDYVEGIYVGYKWFETAYAEGAVITNTKTGETFDYNDYDSIVAYPFGYGLSYTTFTQEITGGTLTDGSALDPTGEYTVEVTVTNTGEVSGKAAVQLYVTAPYTDYDKQNLIEKAAVSLVQVRKTGEIAPGESETVTLSFAAEEVASYDSTHDNGDGTMGAYLLDDGDYLFSVRDDAHTEIESVTVSLDEQYFYAGENKRSSDEVVATNQFEEAARGEYLSRQDAFANYESAMNSVSDAIKDTSYATTDNLYDESLDEAVTKTYTEGVDYAAEGDLTLADMRGLDYDDPQWDELLKQLSIDEMLTLTGNTIYASAAIESIDKVDTTDSDGPLGISSMFRSDLITVAFPCVPLLSATFNTDLAARMGSCIADQAELNGITCWYAPAMDTHRSPYAGRNFEYYSEDGMLAARMAAAEVGAAREKGLITNIKHFFLNDMESHRAFVHTYSSEQAIREIYLKPFEYSVKEGHSSMVMNSMNYIGDVYSGGHVGLLTNVLRGEWGFEGAVLTDMDEGSEFRSFWATIRAGVDYWLGFMDLTITPDSDADIYYLQRACHNILYMFANGNTYETEFENWRLYRSIVYGELGILIVAGLVTILMTSTRKKEEAKAEG